MTPEPVVWVGEAAARVECSVQRARIVHGRNDPTSQPAPSTATLELVGPLPPEAVIGARVEVRADLGGGEQLERFAGEVTDLGVGWDSVDVAVPRIIATGDLGRTGRRPVGDVPWPQELDGARVARVLELAGFPPDPALTDPGLVEVLARDVDRQPALALAHEAADDGGGIVWQDRAGRILYADAVHRRRTPIALELQACDVGLGLGWVQSLEGLVNEVTIRYGPTPEAGEQPEVHATDPVSIAARGLYGASLTTRIATELDAQRRADTVVVRQARPTWVLEGLEVDLELFTLDEVRALLELDVHGLVSVTGLPAGSPATSALLWVEGWSEDIVATQGGGVSWRVAFATSDYCRTAGTPRWDDLPAAETWDTLDPGLVWDSAWCIPPQPSRGRWDDVAASTRWDQLPPALTWDAWPTV